VSPTYVFTLVPGRTGGIRGEDGAAAVRSDTLMAALRSVAADTGILADVLAGPAPPLRVSSLFPEVAGIRLYPRPLAEPAAFGNLNPLEADEFRRIWRRFEYVTEARFESLAEGRRVRFEPEDIIEGRAWGMPSERGLRGLPGRGRSGGIAVDRAGGEPERYSEGRRMLPPGARHFFIARLDDAGTLAPLRELVARLGESGLGGRRSTGAGAFSLAGAYPAPGFLGEGGSGAAAPAGDAGGTGLAAEAASAVRAGPRARILLSLYLPTREEAASGVLDGMAGDAVLRGGWIHSGGPTGLRKRPLRMLVEGTVLSGATGKAEGEVRDVRPEGFERHPVWRDGRALAIPYGGGS